MKIYFHNLILTSMAEDTAESESESEICSTCTNHVMILLVGDHYLRKGDLLDTGISHIELTHGVLLVRVAEVHKHLAE